MKNNILHITLASILVILLVLLTDPFMIWMPSMMAATFILVVVILMSIWVGIIMKEHGGDEREILHRMNAGRAAYLSGIVVLTLGLVIQGINHHIDPWIVVALGIMVVTKLIARLILENKH